jgi:hypothetical protein
MLREEYISLNTPSWIDVREMLIVITLMVKTTMVLKPAQSPTNGSRSGPTSFQINVTG